MIKFTSRDKKKKSRYEENGTWNTCRDTFINDRSELDSVYSAAPILILSFTLIHTVIHTWQNQNNPTDSPYWKDAWRNLHLNLDYLNIT